MLSFTSCLYMLDINAWLVMAFANIFSHSVCCLFVLLMVFFAVQKLLNLIKSHLLFFGFISIILGDGSKKNCCDLCQRVFCAGFPLFYSIQSCIWVFNPFLLLFIGWRNWCLSCTYENKDFKLGSNMIRSLF